MRRVRPHRTPPSKMKKLVLAVAALALLFLGFSLLVLLMPGNPVATGEDPARRAPEPAAAADPTAGPAVLAPAAGVARAGQPSPPTTSARSGPEPLPAVQ